MFYNPIFIAPSDFKSANLSFKKYGGNITLKESQVVGQENFLENAKEAFIFIGGFFDSYYRVVFNEFLQFHKEHCVKFYLSFNGKYCLKELLNTLYPTNLKIYILAHSWGANECILTLLNLSNRIEYLLTLDCVGRRKLPIRPSGINFWENVFISDYLKNPTRANVVALVGGGRGDIGFADKNIVLSHPVDHADVAKMLQVTKFLDIC